MSLAVDEPILNNPFEDPKDTGFMKKGSLGSCRGVGRGRISL